MIGEVGDPYVLLRGRLVAVRQRDELRLAGDEFVLDQAVGDAQRHALDLVHERGVELTRGDHVQQGVGGHIGTYGRVRFGQPDP